MKKLKTQKRFDIEQHVQSFESVSRFVSEGNPLTGEAIEKARQDVYQDLKLIEDTKEAIKKEPALAEALPYVAVTASEGVIVLKGTVESEVEKKSVGEQATGVAGYGKVHNDIQVSEEK